LAAPEEKNTEVTNKIEATVPKKKSSRWDKFVTFLSMGGFLLIIIVVVAFVVGISILVNSC
jgi:hypothetical protein